MPVIASLIVEILNHLRIKFLFAGSAKRYGIGLAKSLIFKQNAVLVKSEIRNPKSEMLYEPSFLERIFHGYRLPGGKALYVPPSPCRGHCCKRQTNLREELGVASGERHELCRGLHAEQNVIIQAAYHGVSIKGATLYCTNLPCSICSKMLINAGICEIIYQEGYADPMAEEMLKASGVKVTQIDD